MQQLSLIQSYLLAERLISRQQLATVAEFAQQHGTTFTCALVLANALGEEQLATFLARRLGLPRAAPPELFGQAPGVIDQLDAAFAVRHRVLALRVEGTELITAMSDPSDSDLVEVIEQRTELTVARMVVLEGALDEALQHHYGAASAYDPQPASGELRALFADRERPKPIPLLRRRSRPDAADAPPGPSPEDLVTAPLPKLPLAAPSFEPPPLPDDLDDAGELDEQAVPPPLPEDALEGAPTTLHSPRVMNTTGQHDEAITAPIASGSKTQPLPNPTHDPPAPATRTRPLPAQADDPSTTATTQPLPQVGSQEYSVVDEYAVSAELAAPHIPPELEAIATAANHQPRARPSMPATVPTLVTPTESKLVTPPQSERRLDESELLAGALTWLEALAARRLLLRLDNAQLRGWVGDGFGPAIDVRSIVVEAEPASVFGRTLGTGRLFVGPLGFSRAERRFAMMVGKHARHLLLAPVVGPSGAIALVYCDELRGALPRQEIERFTTKLAGDLAGHHVQV